MEKLSHQVFFSENIKEDLRLWRNKYLGKKVFVITDYNTQKYCLPKLSEALEPFYHYSISAGEVYKNINTAIDLWRFLSKNLADRESIVVNLGGGVVSDLGGFVASTFKRGVKFINVPTTLLAQVDAAIGGKTGINLDYLKNEVGTFAKPEAVFIAPEFLETLPERDFIAGYAEIVKYALISSPEMWEEVKRSMTIEMNMKNLSQIIRKSVEIKLKIVEKDPYERDLRKILNFGHTFGHAFETFFKLKGIDILHGEAVAMGIICEIYLSNQRFVFDFQRVFEISEVISKFFPTYRIQYKDYDEIYEIMLHDKKNSSGEIHFTLLKDIGDVAINQVVEKSDIYEALNFYSQIR